jgi:TonB family protein
MSDTIRELRNRLEEYLMKCRVRVDDGMYTRALETLREAKAIDPKNIYLIALERQIKVLVGEGFKKSLTPKDQKDIIDSIPEIIRRAIKDVEKRESQTEKHQVDPKIDVEGLRTRERVRALQRQKESYVQLAEEYLDKGDYERALEEIRRIYIIDPENTIARDLEYKIAQLVRLHQPVPEKAQSKKRKSWFPSGKIIPTAIAMLVLLNVSMVYVKVFNSTPETGVYAEIPAVQTAETEKSGLSALTRPAFITAGRSRIIPELTVSVDGLKEADTSQIPYTVGEDGETDAIVENENPEDTLINGESTPLLVSYPRPSRSNIIEKVDTDILPNVVDGNSHKIKKSVPVWESTKKAGKDLTGEVLVEAAADVIHLERPVYPGDAVRNGVEGEVVVRVVLDDDGKPILVTIVRSDHPLLDIPAFNSAKRSVYYRPNTMDKSLDQWVDILYRFTLKSGDMSLADPAL